MSAKLVPMTYRDFYDVPRAVVVRVDDQLLYLDCPIDLDVEDYPDDYQVYRLPDELEDHLASVSWTDLCHLGRWVGRLPVSAVSFDDTKRRFIDPAFIDRVEWPSPRDGLCGQC